MITHLPSELEGVFIDDTATNLATFVTGVMRLWFPNPTNFLERFKGIIDVEVAPSGVTVIPALAQYSLASQCAISGMIQDASDIPTPLMSIRTTDPGKQY